MLNLTLSASFAAILFQLSLGGVGGFLIGFAIRKVLKVALILIAIVGFLLFLAYIDVINVDYSGLSSLASDLVDNINPALNMLTPLLAHIPFIASFIFGIFVGFIRT